MMKNGKRLAMASLAVLLTGAMTVSSITWPFAPQADAAQTTQSDKDKLTDAIGDVSHDLMSTTDDGSLSKNETVYVMANPDGSVDHVIVSDWLKNAGKEAKLSDVSELKNIENVKGEETFSQDGNSLTWNTDGNDIYYQGTTDKSLPVSVNLTYELNGKPVNPQNLSGKSGKLTMTGTYTAQGDLPFTMITALMLPAEHFRNVELENGKLVSDAKTNIAVCLGFPGLNEALDVDKERIDFPSSFTLTADVTDFQMGPTMTIASCGLLNDMELDDFDGMDDLQDALDDLSDASRKLVDGSGELKDGIDTLQSKTGEFKDGVNTLNDGLNQLANGTGTLKDGVHAYTDGANTLTSGVRQYVDGADKVASGAKEYAAGTQELASNVKDYLAGTQKAADGVNQLNSALSGVEISDQTIQTLQNLAASADQIDAQTLSELQNGGAALSNGISAYNNALKQNLDTYVNGAVTQILSDPAYDGLNDVQKGAIQNAVAQALAGVEAQVIDGEQGGAGLKASADQMDAKLKGLSGQLSSMKSGMDSVKPLLSLLPSMKTLPGAVAQIKSGMDQLTSNNQALSDGADLLMKKGTELASGADALTGKSGELKSGADTLSGKSEELRNGVNSLQDASGKLKDGGKTLSDGTKALTDGIKELDDGALTLADGMKEFDKDGIQELKSTFDDDIQGLLDKVDDISTRTKEYKTFSGIREDMNGNVKFIIETTEIK